MRAHEVLLSSSELLDLPDESRLLGDVVHGADRGLRKVGRVEWEERGDDKVSETVRSGETEIVEV